MSLPNQGDVLAGKYRIESVLGEGGYGRVYRATTAGTGRPVAVKVLKARRTPDRARRVERFLREMRTIAKLQSPHTLTLYDFGRTDDGSPFMVCEYVEGEDLSEILATRTLNEDELVHVLKQLLGSLAEAHGLGVLHRDLKPANIRIFEYAGDALRVKLLDFGLVKSFEDPEIGLTGTGRVIGTPRYMSPEQIRGTPLLPASDIYSLGLVAFEMLVGSNASRELAITEQRTLPDGVVSEQVARVVNRMLAFDPAARFRRAEDVLEALAALSAAASAHAPPVVPSEPPAPLPVAVPQPPAAPRTRRLVLSTLVIAAIPVLGALALFGVMDEEDRVEQRTVKHQRSTATRATAPVAAIERATPVVLPSPDPPVPLDRAGCGEPAQFAGYGELETLDGLTMRKQWSYLPRDYDSSRAYPMVVLLHESGVHPETFLRESGFAAIAEREGLVVIAPFGGALAWEKETRPDELIPLAINEAKQRLCVDPARVYLVGHATGGRAAESAGCRIAGIKAISISAFRRRPKGKTPCPEDPVPSIQLTGNQDKYNPIDGGLNCSDVPRAPLTTQEAIWRNRNVCEGVAKVWFEDRGHRCVTWECEEPLVSCVLDGGRGWNGSAPRPFDIRRCDGPSTDFPYAETIWKFFASLEVP